MWCIPSRTPFYKLHPWLTTYKKVIHTHFSLTCSSHQLHLSVSASRRLDTQEGRYTGSPYMIYSTAALLFYHYMQRDRLVTKGSIDVQWWISVVFTGRVENVVVVRGDDVKDSFCRGFQEGLCLLYTWSVFYLSIQSRENVMEMLMLIKLNKRVFN